MTDRSSGSRNYDRQALTEQILTSIHRLDEKIDALGRGVDEVLKEARAYTEQREAALRTEVRALQEAHDKRVEDRLEALRTVNEAQTARLANAEARLEQFALWESNVKGKMAAIAAVAGTVGGGAGLLGGLLGGG